jgi:hypothetical protein
MKNLKLMAGMILTAVLVTLAPSSRADGTNAVAAIKPDLLMTCPVSGDKLGDKDPAKYIKKIQDAAVAAKK